MASKEGYRFGLRYRLGLGEFLAVGDKVTQDANANIELRVACCPSEQSHHFAVQAPGVVAAASRHREEASPLRFVLKGIRTHDLVLRPGTPVVQRACE